MENLESYRQSYDKGELVEAQVPNEPIELFKAWFKEVEENGEVQEVNAMTLATIGKDGFPKARVVLLKEYDLNGFVFYTNYTSEKGQAILENNQTCLSFFWPDLQRQVIIKGVAEKISEEKSAAYFNSRPRGSQLGAWASNQSDEVASREVIEKRLENLKEEYAEKDIPKPSFWGGYLVKPKSVEFWQGRPNRLHDRILFTKIENDNWKIKRLEP